MRRVLGGIAIGAILVLTVLIQSEAMLPSKTRWSIHQVETPEVRSYFTSLQQRIGEVLLEATRSVDVAMYDFTLDALAEVLEQVARRSIAVRIVLSTEGGGGKKELEICKRLEALAGVEVRRRADMHHKFSVVDAEVVLTGSANWTETSLKKEANNLVVIRSRETAGAFAAEFTRLWQGAKHQCDK